MKIRVCIVLCRVLFALSALFLFAVAVAAQPIRVVLVSSGQLWERSLTHAASQVGVRERTGRNDGPEVEAYLRSVGLTRGNPYCQAAQYWAFSIAARQLMLPLTAIPILRTGSTQRAFDHAVRNGVRTALRPQRGDLITWRSHKGYSGHVERVIEVRTGGWVKTIGFNTSAGKRGSQRDGGGVHIRYRNWITPDMRMLVRGFIGRKGSV